MKMSGDVANSKSCMLALDDEVDSNDELDDEISDAMLGGLRRGLITIRNNAKESLEKCKTDESWNDMEERLKSSTIKLIRSEESLLETAKIVAQVVEEISSDFEDDQDEDAHEKIPLDPMSSGRTSMVFRPTFANSVSIANVAKQMATMFSDRLKDFEDSLTEAHLQKHPKFKALETQINLAETQQAKRERLAKTNTLKGYGDGKSEENDFQSGSNDRNKAVENFYDSEESQVDFSVLPSVDPISRRPIQLAMKNKYCNHVFEDMSIREFMAVNPEATCPMHGCLNKRKLEPEHLIFDPILNDQIHAKHCAAGENLY